MNRDLRIGDVFETQEIRRTIVGPLQADLPSITFREQKRLEPDAGRIKTRSRSAFLKWAERAAAVEICPCCDALLKFGEEHDADCPWWGNPE